VHAKVVRRNFFRIQNTAKICKQIITPILYQVRSKFVTLLKLINSSTYASDSFVLPVYLKHINFVLHIFPIPNPEISVNTRSLPCYIVQINSADFVWILQPLNIYPPSSDLIILRTRLLLLL
jgi:hypothetical protein